jgi:membrane-bound lytic murein transglycosylase D
MPIPRVVRPLSRTVITFVSATLLAGCMSLAPSTEPAHSSATARSAASPVAVATPTGPNDAASHDPIADLARHRHQNAATAPVDPIAALLAERPLRPALSLGASAVSPNPNPNLKRDAMRLGDGPVPESTVRPGADSARGIDAPRLADRDAITLEDTPARTAPARQADVWTRIRSGFAMPDLDSPLVAQRVRWYLARPDLLAQMLERGAPYLHFILEEIEARDMPTELALLPFVESAMNPIALSHASASGLWQFIPATGKRFELSQDWWVDERRDIVESTRAALEYLQEVHDMHGNDWFLALASYNWGENAVARAVRSNLARGRPAGYPDLRMPQETRHYVPKLLALKRIVLQAAELGIVLPHIPDTPYFTTVQHTRPLDMKLAARFAGMSLDDFTLLNPAHNRPVIATHRHDEIKLPVDRVAAFRQAAAHHEAQRMPFVTWRPHTLAPGEDLNTIAARHDMTPADILRANGLPGQSTPRPGSRILVPTRQAGDPAALEAFDRPSLILPEARQRMQRSTVRRGGRSASMLPPRSSTAARNVPAGAKAASPRPDKAKATGAKLTRTAAKAPPAHTRRATAGPRSGTRR